MTCNICGYSGTFSDFGGRKKVLCPVCNSLERHRAVWREVSKNFSDETTILHVGPEKCLYQVLKQNKSLYYPIDIDPNSIYIRHVADLTRLPYPDDFFDIIICCHVLDEVSDDSKAINEMIRVLKQDGIIYLTTFINESIAKTIERNNIKTNEERKQYYGSEKRNRLYAKDFSSKLMLSGLDVDIMPFDLEKTEPAADKNIFICKKV